jgi:hypothetical protein
MDCLSFIIGWYIFFLIALETDAHRFIFQVECLAIADGPAFEVRPLASSKTTRAVHFQSGCVYGQTARSDEHASISADVSMLSKIFGIWRFNSRQQFRMQMVRCRGCRLMQTLCHAFEKFAGT